MIFVFKMIDDQTDDVITIHDMIWTKQKQNDKIFKTGLVMNSQKIIICSEILFTVYVYVTL